MFPSQKAPVYVQHLCLGNLSLCEQYSDDQDNLDTCGTQCHVNFLLILCASPVPWGWLSWKCMCVLLGASDLWRCDCEVHPGGVGSAGSIPEEAVQRCDAGHLEEPGFSRYTWALPFLVHHKTSVSSLSVLMYELDYGRGMGWMCQMGSLMPSI